MSEQAWPSLVPTFHADEVVSDGGLVTAPDPRVAEAGADVLAAGGNAVDAIVAAAFAEGVVEPPMSGIGGGATMTLALRDPDRVVVVEGHMVAPLEATTERFPLAKEQPDRSLAPGGWSVTFFDQPVVEGYTNVLGAKAVAAPGAVAALLAAQERFGRLPRERVLRPAIRLAAEGFRVSWFLAACVASDLAALARDPGCAEVFLYRGAPLRGPLERPGARLRQPKLARTLEILAAEGADALYRGELGRSVVKAVRGLGGLLSEEDLARYRPRIAEQPATAPFDRFTLFGAPVSGFPSIVETLNLHALASPGARVSPADALAWATALKLAFADRFAYLTGDASVSLPLAGLMSSAYARARLDAERSGGEPPDPGRYGDEPASTRPAAARPGLGGHTSQVAAVDAEGNMASLTATILGEFGARVLDPGTGILLNNGMAYFDPRPGAVNGIRPGVQVLSAMTPMVLAEDARGPVAAVGASGGWRIISGLAQIVSALAGGVSLQEAIESPRLHAETSTVLLEATWPREAGAVLEEHGFTVVPVAEEPTTVHFARANGVVITPDGRRRSGVDPRKPAGAAVA